MFVDHHHHGVGWFSVACGTLLLALFAWFLFQQIRHALARRIHRTNPPGLDGSEPILLRIEGMNCQNCVKKIESALLKCDGILSAVVDLGDETVLVEGTAETDTVRQIIEGTGFDVEAGPVAPSEI